MSFLPSSLAPTGTVLPYAGSAAPAGWVLCDGSAISRTTYSDLFTVLSTTYGSGDGSTTFNVPNAQGVFLRGAGSQTISAVTYTGTRGTSQIDAYPSHNHGGGSHTHTIGTNQSAGGGGGTTPGSANTNGASAFPSTSGPSATVIASNGSGSETRPANISVNYIIKI